MDFHSDNDDDKAWSEAVDWFLRIQEDPENRELRAGLQRWLKKDPAHAATYQEAQLVWDLTGKVSAQRKSPSQVRSRGRFKKQVLAGGCSVLAASLVLLVLTSLWPKWSADFSTDLENHQIVLNDGSRIHLSAQSALSVNFNQKHRQTELLKGGAFFDVSPNVQRPFRVKAGNAVVAVLGTRFDVQLQDSNLQVAVEEGTVRVLSSDKKSAMEVTLKRGELVRVDLETGRAIPGRVDSAQVASWRRGELLVENWSVAEALEVIDRYYPGQILILDDALAKKTISGVYDLHNPERAARAVLAPYKASLLEWPYFIVITSG